MKQKIWERLRSRILLVVVVWPWAGGILGVVAASFDSEHTSIIYVILGLIVGVCGAASDTAFTFFARNKSQLSKTHWLWVGASTTLLAVPVFLLLVPSEPFAWETVKSDAIFAATFGTLPAFAIALILSQISKMRSNSRLVRTPGTTRHVS